MTIEDVNPKTLDLIAKLHALATNKGATEAEAANAMGKMQALLAKHNLDISDITMSQADHNAEVRDERGDVMGKAREMFGNRRIRANGLQWIVDLASSVARYNFGAILVGPENSYVVFVGKSHNIAAIKEIWAYAVEQVNDLASEAYKLSPRSTDGRIWKRNFSNGCVTRLTERLRADWLAMQQASVDTKALIVVNDTAVSTRVSELSGGGVARRRAGKVRAGQAEGYLAGNRVNLGLRPKQVKA